MRSGSEAGSYSRLVDFVHHSTLGLRVIKKKEEGGSGFGFRVSDLRFHLQTLTIYEVGLNQTCNTFTSMLLTKIVLCSKFP